MPTMADTTTLTSHDAPLAPPIVPAAAPITEDAFVADRQKFWSWFTGMVSRAVITIVVLLALLWFFLVR